MATTDWAEVTYFPFRHGPFKDDTVDYAGQVLEDNDDFIALMVFGSQMTFPKKNVIVRRFQRAVSSHA